MKAKLLILFFLSNLYLFAQKTIQGSVTNEQANKLLGVSIYYKNTSQGVTTNKNGDFQINSRPKDTLVFQYLGYQSQEIVIANQNFLQIQLEPESIHLRQVILKSTEDPAYEIIRKAIARREENKNKLTAYQANFYSRGMVEVKIDSVFLKKIAGKLEEDEKEDFKDTIVPYLSETISKIFVQPPKHFFEEIIASKVSGEKTLFSYNSAEEAEISFYETKGSFLLSPIANNALQFYDYTFEGDFYQDKQLINKIRIRPKRKTDKAWSGTLYIVEETSEIYGIDVEADASILQIPMLNTYGIRQTFIYNQSQKAWVKNLQEINFEGNLLKNYFSGRFIAYYQDYKFGPLLHNFTRERMRILPDAFKTDSFWEEKRPVALTRNEINDYKKKDSIQEVRKSKTYLDSMDRKYNKLKIFDPITGYTYRNSSKNWNLNYGGLINSSGGYNTVQGLSLSSNLVFTKYYTEGYTNYLQIRTDIDYGISDERARISGQITRKFNAITHAKLNLFAGIKTSQFNRAQPISPLWNTVYTILDNRNYMKLYDLGRYGMSYSQEITNGVFLTVETAWERRSPLYNTKIREKYADRLTSNDPLNPKVENSVPFNVHSLLRTKLGFQIRFAQNYYSHPNQKIINSAKGPVIYLGMIAGTFASEKNMDFLQLQMKLRQRIDLGQMGNTNYLIHAGTFVNRKSISFADFQHFTGNEIYIGHHSIESFQLLPYYKNSTDQSYLAVHWEHHFNDAIMRRIPLIRSLKLQLVSGANFLAIKENKPYTEWYVGLDKIGIKSWRLLRIDFVQSYSERHTHSGIRLRIGL